MKFQSKHGLGDVIEYRSSGSTKIETVVGVMFVENDTLYETTNGDFVPQSRVLATYTRAVIQEEQLKLPIVESVQNTEVVSDTVLEDNYSGAV